MLRFCYAVLCIAVVVVAGACGDAAPERDLRELVVRGSTYLAPETMAPFSGRVFRPFPGDSTRTEVEGRLVDGTWHGELVVYHPSGRLRYAGSFAHGEKCGPWTEGLLDREPVNLYDELTSDIESMGIYPSCPPDVD